jgi:hypothetical protein
MRALEANGLAAVHTVQAARLHAAAAPIHVDDADAKAPAEAPPTKVHPPRAAAKRPYAAAAASVNAPTQHKPLQCGLAAAKESAKRRATEAPTETTAAAPACEDNEQPKPSKRKKTAVSRCLNSLQVHITTKSYQGKGLGYLTHKERDSIWEKLIRHNWQVGDKRLQDFTGAVTLDVQDGTFPAPLCVTTYPFEHTDSTTQYGIVVWTKPVCGTGFGSHPKIEIYWLQPLDGAKPRVVAAFMNKFITHCDMMDMEEEVILGFKCCGGLFLLEGAEGSSEDLAGEDAVWKILPDGTAVAHDSIVAQRGM